MIVSELIITCNYSSMIIYDNWLLVMMIVAMLPSSDWVSGRWRTSQRSPSAGASQPRCRRPPPFLTTAPGSLAHLGSKKKMKKTTRNIKKYQKSKIIMIFHLQITVLKCLETINHKDVHNLRAILMFFPQQCQLMGSSAEIGSAVLWHFSGLVPEGSGVWWKSRGSFQVRFRPIRPGRLYTGFPWISYIYSSWWCSIPLCGLPIPGSVSNRWHTVASWTRGVRRGACKHHWPKVALCAWAWGALLGATWHWQPALSCRLCSRPKVWKSDWGLTDLDNQGMLHVASRVCWGCTTLYWVWAWSW